jgi:ferrous iron transport protein B
LNVRKVLLFGNPNVGKSAMFNRLTGASVIISNYPGTTVEFTRGSMKLGEERVVIEDAPGIYSLEPTSRAEEVAVQMLDELGEDGVVVVVLDSTNLERGLFLALQVLKRRRPTVVALNLWDEAKHIGVGIDVQKLAELLGVPCVPTVAITGVGAKDLVKAFPEAEVPTLDFEDPEIWHTVGDIVGEVQTLTHRHHTLLERLGDASVRPLTGIPFAIVVILLSFFAIRYIGEGLITLIEPVFEKYWSAAMLTLSDGFGNKGFFHNIIVGELADEEIGEITESEAGEKLVTVEKRKMSVAQAQALATEESAARFVERDKVLVARRIDYGESFGLLTTGLFVPIGAVLPYVFAFFLVLSLLEDSGYLPRLAVLSDTVMHRLGLHGMSIIPMLLGLGCAVPGALSARILESKRERFIAITLMAICVPCMAQIAMIVGLAGKFGPFALVPIFATLFVVWVLLGSIMKRLVRGESPELIIDVPPYRLPYWKGLLKKVWMRFVWFIRGAVPWVLAGVFIINILHTLRVIEFIGGIVEPVITGLLDLPPKAVGALIMGFLRKDIAVGLLAPLGLSMRQVIVACVVLTMYFPCVGAFAVMFKELGPKDMLKSAVVMLCSALAVGTILNLLLGLFL